MGRIRNKVAATTKYYGSFKMKSKKDKLNKRQSLKLKLKKKEWEK